MPTVPIKPIVLAAAHAVVLAAVLAACAPGSGPNPASGTVNAPVMAAEPLTVLGYTAPVPASWQRQPPASTFRAAQFKVPPAVGATEGELIVFYFGRGQGGSAALNAERWTSQFTTPAGGPVAPRMQTLEVNGIPVTVVELAGHYARGIGNTQGQPGKPGQTLLAAVIETPDGNVIVQLHGDSATVQHHRGGFDALVRGFKAR